MDVYHSPASYLVGEEDGPVDSSLARVDVIGQGLVEHQADQLGGVLRGDLLGQDALGGWEGT